MTLDDPLPRFQRHTILRRFIYPMAYTVLYVITKDEKAQYVDGA